MSNDSVLFSLTISRCLSFNTILVKLWHKIYILKPWLNVVPAENV